MFYSNPAHALLTDTTTGGWVGVETIDSQCGPTYYQRIGTGYRVVVLR